MTFSRPDPENMRISDCGRYILVRRSKDGVTVYDLWQYELAVYGFGTAEEAMQRAQALQNGSSMVGVA